MVAFGGYLLSQVLSAYKWQVLARPLGFLQPLHVFILYYFSGMYLNLFAPSTVAGDFSRGALLAGDSGRLGAALQSVVADRVSGLLMLLWIGVVGLLSSDFDVVPVSVRYGIIVVAVGAIAGWFFLPRVLQHGFLSGHQVRNFVERLILPYQKVPSVLGRACGLSLGFHFLQISLQILLAHALQLDTLLWTLVVSIVLVALLSGLPVSFGGVGVREGGYIMFLTPLGVEREQALAFGLLWSAVVLVANATGGLALLLAPKTHHLLIRKQVSSTKSQAKS